MTISLRRPVSGLAVKSTPDASLATMACTATASATPSCAMPFLARYAIARAVHRLLQQPRTASSSASFPMTLRYVSCWPAKLMSGRSSAVAEERTATGR